MERHKQYHHSCILYIHFLCFLSVCVLPVGAPTTPNNFLLPITTPGYILPGTPGYVAPTNPAYIIPSTQGYVAPTNPASIIPSTQGFIAATTPGYIVPSTQGNVAAGAPGFAASTTGFLQPTGITTPNYLAWFLSAQQPNAPSSPVSNAVLQQVSTDALPPSSLAPGGILTPAINVQVNAVPVTTSTGGRRKRQSPSSSTTSLPSQLTTELAQKCSISPARITNVALTPAPNNTMLLLRFTIAASSTNDQVSSSQILSTFVQCVNLKALLPINSTAALNLTQPIYYWTDSGPCPNQTCMNGGVCVLSLTGYLACQCPVNQMGSLCEVTVTVAPITNNNGLLGLITIPIVVAIIVIGIAVGYVILRRRGTVGPEKLRPVDTEVASFDGDSQWGKSTISKEPGARNMVYNTTVGKSYAIAFNDNAFSTLNAEEGVSQGDKTMALF